LDDGELLDLIRDRRSDDAFAALVHRHGPMVWRVCRRVLRDVHRVEDAFQGTFLVLFRNVDSIRKTESLGGWLHGVAYRVATKARTGDARRIQTSGLADLGAPEPPDDLDRQELRAVLDEELSRLPPKYRAPVVLCYLQDATQEEAARQLGCPRSSLASRLERAKALLRERLTRRGLALPFAGLVAALSEMSAAGAVPARLLASVAGNVPLAAAGQAGALSPRAVALAEGVLPTMSATKVTTALALVVALTAVLSTTLVLGDQPPAPARQWDNATGPVAAPAPGEEGAALFRDVTAAAGVDFTYRNGEEADQYTVLESLGGGVVLIDYDGDGLLDIFLPGGGEFVGEDKTQIKGHPCKLYKNLGNFKFKDVTKQVGLDRIAFYTHGAAVADYDCDGWPDLLVTGYGGAALFRNEPDGKGGRRFVDVTKKAGLDGNLWSTSAAWADLDGDGFPDLYVCHYCDWSFKKHPKFTPDGKNRDVCPPWMFSAQPHKLYRNRGDGTFVDVSKEAGLRTDGRGLGVVAADLDGDGKPDLFVANDTDDNFLYLNRSTSGKLRFVEVGLEAGIARDDRGNPTGSRGLAVGDYDGTGRPSVLVTTSARESPSLFRNLSKSGQPLFRYATQKAGLAEIGRDTGGCGAAFFDADLDGRLDLFIAHGNVSRHATDKTEVASRPVLLRNDGQKLTEFGESAGPYFRKDRRGRGVAVGDLDNDGRVDLVVSHLNEPVVLLRNEVKLGQKHWVGIELRGKNHRSVVGARVTLEVAGLPTQTRQVVGGGSFASTSDPRLVFGLGGVNQIGKLTVHWPDGSDQVWDGLKVDRYHTMSEGEKKGP
jgi:RNA polymerase sigma factor (sigma-70 family)